jgi:hypothetical protein
VIRNGFDPDDARAAPAASHARFRIVYTGKLDLAQQDPRPLFEGLAAATRDGEIPAERLQLVFHCYGDTPSGLRDLAAGAGLAQSFEWGGSLDQASSLDVQASADALLLFAWGRDPSCVPAKLYDYLAAERRILVLGPRGEAARLVVEAGRGAWASSAEECRRVLGTWYREWRRDGRLPAGGDAAQVARHAFVRRAGEMAELMEELARTRAGR